MLSVTFQDIEPLGINIINHTDSTAARPSFIMGQRVTHENLIQPQVSFCQGHILANLDSIPCHYQQHDQITPLSLLADHPKADPPVRSRVVKMTINFVLQSYLFMIV